jgi:hypothetical protein
MFLYVSYEEDLSEPRYISEALISAYSLRRHTSAAISLVTNNPEFVARFEGREWFPFTDVEIVDIDARVKFSPKVASIAKRAGRDTIFLDTDTIVMSDISRVFEFDDFEFAGVPQPDRRNITDIDKAVKQERRRRFLFNSGVMFIRANLCSTLGQRWAHHFQIAVRKQGPKAPDQLALARALQDLEPKLFHLPPNYNFRGFGGFMSGACFVYHTHFADSALDILAKDFDREAMDAFIARIETINDTFLSGIVPPYWKACRSNWTLSRAIPPALTGQAEKP